LAGIPFPVDVQTMFVSVRRAAREDGVAEAKRIWRRSTWLTPVRDQEALGRELDHILGEYSGWHWTHDNPFQNIDPPAAERLTELDIPSAIITGEHDLAYNAAIGQLLVSRVRGATELRLPDAGHLANMEAPQAVNRAIVQVAALADYSSRKH
ncbi:MAG TPA: alpha/beta hydrolase, partial [Polyangiaceae bacterium]|nr:alpha/beta hydrolase [Polyangiaceae bacterium]